MTGEHGKNIADVLPLRYTANFTIAVLVILLRSLVDAYKATKIIPSATEE